MASAMMVVLAALTLTAGRAPIALTVDLATERRRLRRRPRRHHCHRRWHAATRASTRATVSATTVVLAAQILTVHRVPTALTVDLVMEYLCRPRHRGRVWLNHCHRRHRVKRLPIAWRRALTQAMASAMTVVSAAHTLTAIWAPTAATVGRAMQSSPRRRQASHGHRRRRRRPITAAACAHSALQAVASSSQPACCAPCWCAASARAS